MFQNNDKYLVVARKILSVLSIILGALGVITGLILCSLEVYVAGLILMLVEPILCLIVWFVGMLVLSYLCDVKLIRNKLYGESNDYLKDFLSQKSEPKTETVVPTQQDGENAQTFSKQSGDDGVLESYALPEYDRELLHKLKCLYESGAITQEEYRQEKAKILK